MRFQHGFYGCLSIVLRRPFRTLFAGDPIRWLKTTGYTTSPLPGFFQLDPTGISFPEKNADKFYSDTICKLFAERL
jgi:hypothetical protein